jgi:hypothetical protein
MHLKEFEVYSEKHCRDREDQNEWEFAGSGV